jgi:Family of unknown function (DUF6445)
MVRYAVHESQFEPSPLAYPGIIAPAPEAYIDGLVRVLVPIIGDTFAVKVDTAHLTECNLSIATIPPEKLHFGQRLPHVDDFSSGTIAILHYLCTQGGTAWYRHQATGYETLDREKHDHMKRLMVAEVARNPLPAQYPNANDRLFEQMAYFQATYNCVIAYRSKILHSMSVDANTNLSPDPRVGRLTVNSFLRFESA